jgi:endonuclease/exonuclease/phosphatase family metal-dependent hydrolase
MKIIQANIWGGKLDQQVIDFFRQEQPDFACLQEVNDLAGRPGAKRFATLNDIKAGAGFDHAYMSPTYSFRFMRRRLNFGNAILSKLPLASTDTVFTGGEYAPDFDVMEDKPKIRNLQLATVNINGVTLNILNHHGHWVHGTKAGNDETTKQMRIVDGMLESCQGPVIFCGDFNLSPRSQSLAIINDKLTNLSIKNNLTRTYNQFSDVNEVCDYIFVNSQIKVRRFEMSEFILSDHKALILEFDVLKV